MWFIILLLVLPHFTPGHSLYSVTNNIELTYENKSFISFYKFDVERENDVIYISMSFILENEVTTSNDIRVDFTSLKFDNHQYRRSSLTFGFKLCQVGINEMLGFEKIFDYSDLHDCPIEKGIHYVQTSIKDGDYIWSNVVTEGVCLFEVSVLQGENIMALMQLNITGVIRKQ